MDSKGFFKFYSLISFFIPRPKNRASDPPRLWIKVTFNCIFNLIVNFQLSYGGPYVCKATGIGATYRESEKIVALQVNECKFKSLLR